MLAAYNWPKNTDRYLRVRRFVEALFTKWDKFQQPPRHPKWRDVNLAATVPGWTRLNTAEEMLQKLRPKIADQAAGSDFAAFLKNSGPGGASLNDQQREALFREFLRWQERKRAGR